MPATFTFQRGEPIIIDLVIDDAGSIDPVNVTVAMRLKKGTRPPPQSDPAIAEFVLAYVPASGSDMAYWRGTIADSSAIDPGDYVTDAVLSLDDAVIAITDPVRVQIRGSVTPA